MYRETFKQKWEFSNYDRAKSSILINFVVDFIIETVKLEFLKYLFKLLASLEVKNCSFFPFYLSFASFLKKVDCEEFC